MRAVVFTAAGGNEVVRVEQRPDPAPGAGEVLVEAVFAGLNPADTLQRAGRYPAPPGSPPDVPGLELAGTVISCGERVESWGPGDRVFGLVGGGGLADRAVAHGRHLAAVPETLDEQGAAAVPEAFITAHDAVALQGGLRPGETLLVHGAAGGVGSAAIQIGVAMGARVFGSVRSDAAAGLVRELGAEPVLDSKFAEAVPAADVILELVGASHFPANLDALADKGRIVVVGVGAGHEIALSLYQLMRKRAVLRGTVLRSRSLEEKALAVRAFEREIVPLLAAGRLRPVVDSVYPVERIADAFDRLDGPGKRGKVLIEFS